jgi:hypothetical protein
MPTRWLIAQDTLLELNAANGVRLSPSATTIMASATDREKENGAALATFLGGMFIPTYFHLKDNGLAKGLCKGRETSSASMADAAVGQEVGKDLYGKNNSFLEFEQGVVPGLFFGSMVANSAGQAMSQTLCNRLVPKFDELFIWQTADAVMKMIRVLH